MASSTPSGIGIWSTGVPEELSVPLVNVDSALLAAVQVGEGVRVLARPSRLDVTVRRKILGEVAPDFEEAVRQSGLRRGHVESVDRVSSGVTVRLR